MRRRALAVVLALGLGAAAVSTPAAAGVDGELATFAAAVDDLARASQEATASIERPMVREDTRAALVAGALTRLHTAVAVVRASSAPVAEHLATGRLTASAAATGLAGAARALAEAAQDVARLSAAQDVARLSAAPTSPAAATGETPALPVSPGELLGPAIRALAAALEALGPALEALRPAIEPLAPVIDPVCGQVPGVVFLALGLGPVLLPVPLPTLPVAPAVLAGSLLAPVFLTCAALPLPADAESGDELPADDAVDGGDTDEASTAAPVPPRAAADASTGPGASSEAPVGSTPETFLAAALPTMAAGPAGGARTGAQSSLVAPARGASASPVAAALDIPLLPVDHSGEATGIAVAVLVAGGVAAAATAWARRRRQLTDWAVPAAAATGVAAIAAAALGWNGAAEQLATWAQVPYLISGGLTALVLGVVSLTLAISGPLVRIVAATGR